MKEPFEPEAARRYVVAILEGPGMTVFTKSLKDALLEHDMTSLDAVNVLRGGRIAKNARSTPAGWTYRAETSQMVVEFSFAGGHVKPAELVLERAWRVKR